MKSLATAVATPAKKCGRKRSSSPAFAGPETATPAGARRGEAFRIHFERRRSIDEMRTSLLELAPVAGFIAGISAEILVRAELPRIDEDRDHDSIGEAKALTHPRDAALTE